MSCLVCLLSDSCRRQESARTRRIDFLQLCISILSAWSVRSHPLQESFGLSVDPIRALTSGLRIRYLYTAEILRPPRICQLYRFHVTLAPEYCVVSTLQANLPPSSRIRKFFRQGNNSVSVSYGRSKIRQIS